MSHANAELASRGSPPSTRQLTGDIRPWQQHVEERFDTEVVLLSPKEAFTEGEWRGREGAVGFVANQMEVLEDMWLRAVDCLPTTAGSLG